MPIARKVLWIVDYDSNSNLFADYARNSGCDTLCIRTWSSKLEAAIPVLKNAGKTVWAWRWPCVQPDTTRGPHALAKDEAAFVAQKLIPAGLDGYVVDPESNDDQKPTDWNREQVPDPDHPGQQIKLAKMASDFCQTIKTAAAAAGRPFHFGITSGCAFPGPGQKTKLPWAEFITPSDSVYPQCYWRWHNDDNRIVELNGGTPDAAIQRAVAAWQPVAQGKPIIPMAGEINLVTADEIAAYGAALNAMHVTEANFYIDQVPVAPDVLAAIKAL